jgi:hypothetical protein
MNRTLTIAGGIALFFAGMILGLFLRRIPAEPDPHPTREVVAPKPNPESSPARDPADSKADIVRLETRIRELEVELKGARQAGSTADTGLAAGTLEEVFKTYLEMEGPKRPDPDKFRALLARLGQLDEKSAGHFIDLFRKLTEHKERKVAMELALASGGPAAADFVNMLLNDASLDSDLRQNLLRELGGSGDGLFSIRRLPIPEPLNSTAMTLCRSANMEERKAGAGLLGGLRSDIARAELRRLVEEDKDLSVRAAAILSLGHVGDASTRIYLERLGTSPQTAALPGVDANRFREAIESAVTELGQGPR